MRKAFDIEDINVDDLIATAMDDPQAVDRRCPAFRGINFSDLVAAYGSSARTSRRKWPASTSAR